jgi:hypothetical protein
MADAVTLPSLLMVHPVVGSPPPDGPVMATPLDTATEPVPEIVVGLTVSVMPCVTGVDMISDMTPPADRSGNPSGTKLPFV